LALGLSQGVALVALAQAIEEMKIVFKDVPYGIEHTMRVLRNAQHIMDGEGIVGEIREVASLAAVLHDIGAIEAQKKHGSMEGKFQEMEGPSVARPILERIGVGTAVASRVCHIVGNHHSPEKIDGIDFQILWEADYLEYLQFGDKQMDDRTLRKEVQDNFRTHAGRTLAAERLGA
jgi:HD superfamily phosphodiesterase